LDEGETVEPGAEKTFSFDVTAPATAGTYKFQWQMVQENVEWFGSMSYNQYINVGRTSGYIDDCDALADWEPSGDLSIDSTNQKQGDGSIVFTGEVTDEFKKLFTDPISIEGSKADAILEFWYYHSDPSKMSGSNQVELGSGGQPDVDEYNWRVEGLREGWNYVRLKLSEAGKLGNPDLSSINWFRFYSFKSDSITSKIDGLKITGMNTSVSVKELYCKSYVSIYPNPVCNQGVSVDFRIESLSKVSMSVFNMSGSVVSQPLSNHSYEPGAHRLDVSLENIFPGTYFMQITFDGVPARTHKIIVI
jgi:hypothetical protein